MMRALTFHERPLFLKYLGTYDIQTMASGIEQSRLTCPTALESMDPRPSPFFLPIDLFNNPMGVKLNQDVEIEGVRGRKNKDLTP